VRGSVDELWRSESMVVAEYFRQASAPTVAWEEPTVRTVIPAAMPGAGDPLFAVWSRSVHSTT
jgi:hypothetical protein